jgi:hypothetical protein
MIRVKGCRQFNRNSTIWENQHVENQANRSPKVMGCKQTGRQRKWIAKANGSQANGLPKLMVRQSDQVTKGNGLPKQMGRQSKRVAKVNGSPKWTGRQNEWVAKVNGSQQQTGRQSEWVTKVNRVTEKWWVAKANGLPK